MLERVFEKPKFRVFCLGGLKLVEADSGADMTPASRKTRALLGYDLRSYCDLLEIPMGRKVARRLGQAARNSGGPRRCRNAEARAGHPGGSSDRERNLPDC
jgi:hypothetical protein